ncbi:unnamed protein product [Vitrella brassicaformis CCMP3155]|uniref:Calcium uniporter protein C-terminal domain-containing protein n=1 Tax=Vitrella brassicaformis (strain CCMP3155) TaxID=1169540 RepID=A0A0G4EJQ8_VITBC|nr:unnamed protein product [Vitrella brassicaformis CCMP3155]|eukprot:CEL96777.1 unnamed protein product [Vitrella brassicaformis CCMP3155]
MPHSCRPHQTWQGHPAYLTAFLGSRGFASTTQKFIPPLSVQLAFKDGRDPVIQFVFDTTVAQQPIMVPIANKTVGTLSKTLGELPSSPDKVDIHSPDGLPLAPHTPLDQLVKTGLLVSFPDGSTFPVPPLILHVFPPRVADDNAAELPAPSAGLEARAMTDVDYLKVQARAKALVPVSSMVERLRTAVSSVAKVPATSGELERAIESALVAERAERAAAIHQLRNEARTLRNTLDPMRELKNRLDRQATWTVGLWAWGSVAFFSLEFTGIAYGTFWLYNWDIMEPLTYLLGFFDAVAAYTFYAFVRTDYSAGSFIDAVVARKRRRLYRRHKLDLTSFEGLEMQLRQVELQLQALRDTNRLEMDAFEDKKTK